MSLLSYFRKKIYPYEEVIGYIPPYSNILDIGCGDSHILADFSKINIKSYTGIDPKIKKSIYKKNIVITNDTIEDILKNLEKFDCILMIDVMHHIKKIEQEKIMIKILSAMKKNSIFIYKDISNRNKFYSFMNKLHDFLYNFEKINYFDSKKIISILYNKKQYTFDHFYKRIFWYDHEFFIIKYKF